MRLGLNLSYLLGTTAFIDPYAVGGYNFDLVFDFENEYYRTDNATTDFNTAITHSRLGNATMVDSDGLLKWGPHNLLKYSSDITAGSWSKDAGMTLTDEGNGEWLVEYSGANEDLAYLNLSTANSLEFTAEVELKGVPGETIRISSKEGGGELKTLTADWVTYSVTQSNASQEARFTLDTFGGATARSVWMRKPRVYRSDLGGMVNNPDTNDSYVPTTASAVYLPRRGHHIWNGSAWVNEGLLVESEARTNLLDYSEDFSQWSIYISATTTANSATGPDGNVSMSKLVANSNGSGIYVITSLTTNVGNNSQIVSLIDGSLGSLIGGSFDSIGAIDCGDGIYRVYASVSGVTASIYAKAAEWDYIAVQIYYESGNVRFYVYPAQLSTGQGQADNTSGIYIYGAQLEAGSTPSSYIPTNGSTGTRPAETLTVPSAQLPWPTPNVIGPELVTNGTFDTDISGWTIFQGTATWNADGTVTVSRLSNTNDGLYQIITTEPGKVYYVTYLGSGSARVEIARNENRINGVNTDVVGPSSGSASLTPLSFTFTATVSTTYIFLDEAAGQKYDNISVREIDPLAVSMQMQGRMTYADTDIPNEVVFLQWQAAANNQIYHRVRTNVGDGQTQFVQTTAGITDASENGASDSPAAVNLPYNHASRHGSTFIHGAIDGTALTEDTDPVALPDLSSTDLNLAYDYMGTVKLFRLGDGDLGDTGIATASKTPLGTDFVLVMETTSAGETVTIPAQNVGTFDAGIDWGDGSFSTITAYNDAGLTHTYATAGEHTIRISGTFPNIYFNNGGDKAKVKRVEQLGDVGWTRLNNAFYGCSNMTSFVGGTTDTSSVTNMLAMFRNCSSLTTLDVSNFDTSSVTSMFRMFFICSSLTTLDVSGFDTSSVTNMQDMFFGCSSLIALNVSSFDTSSVTIMQSMFNGCSSLGVVDISGWDVANVTNGTDFMLGANNALDTTEYDQLLVAWEAQPVQSGVTWHFGDAQYTSGSAADTARTNLINNDSWTITDGGSV